MVLSKSFWMPLRVGSNTISPELEFVSEVFSSVLPVPNILTIPKIVIPPINTAYAIEKLSLKAVPA